MAIEFFNLFNNTILGRGIDYYRSGYVSNLEVHDGIITAIVQGTYSYDVRIEIVGDQVIELECTCPYAQKDEYCKHMAAVLYAVEDKASQREIIDFDEAYERVPPDLCKDYLKKMLNKDGHLRKSFMQQHPKIFGLEPLDKVLQLIKSLPYIENYFDYDGCYHCEELIGCLENISVYIHQYSDEGRWEGLFEILKALYNSMDGLEYDSDCGDIPIHDGDLEALLTELVESSKSELREDVLKWIKTSIDDGELFNFSREITGYVYTDEAVLDIRISRAERMLLTISASQNSYYYENKVEQLLRMYNEKGNSEVRIQELLEKYKHINGIFKRYVEKLIDNQAYLQAIAELVAKDQEGGMPGYIVDQLIELYSVTENISKLKSTLIRKMKQGITSDIAAFKKYKSLIQPETWISEREQLFEGLLSVKKNLNNLYAEEQMYGRILDFLEKNPSYNETVRYEKFLLHEDYERTMKVFIDSLNHMMKRANHRELYHETIQYLKHVMKLEAGGDQGKQLANQWRGIYKRRKAMLDELVKAGF